MSSDLLCRVAVYHAASSMTPPKIRNMRGTTLSTNATDGAARQVSAEFRQLASAASGAVCAATIGAPQNLINGEAATWVQDLTRYRRHSDEAWNAFRQRGAWQASGTCRE